MGKFNNSQVDGTNTTIGDSSVQALDQGSKFEEEVVAMRERLRDLTSKHAAHLRPKSVDLLSDVLASVATPSGGAVSLSGSVSVSTAPVMSVLSAFTPPPAEARTETQTQIQSTLTPRSFFPAAHAAALVASLSAASASGLSAIPFPSIAASPSCLCVSVVPTTVSNIINAADNANRNNNNNNYESIYENDNNLVSLIRCTKCHAIFPPLRSLAVAQHNALAQFISSLQQLDKALDHDKILSEDAAKLVASMEHLSLRIDAFSEEEDRHNNDLSLLNEKVKDEITRKQDLTRDISALKDELEELSASLIKEANVLVAGEASQRRVLEDREKELESKVAETREMLKREQVQLRELKIKMEAEYSALASANPNNILGKLQPIDESMFAEFKEFISLAPNTKLSKLPNLQFLKNIIEDDVLPTLRFGGNPRTSTRKLLDAISMDLLIVQEMTPIQFSNWLAASQLIQEAVKLRVQALNDARITAAATIGTAASSTATTPTIDNSYIPSLASRSRKNSEIPPILPPISKEAAKATAMLYAISHTPTHSVFQKTMVERVSLWTSISSSTPPTALANSSSAISTTQTGTSITPSSSSSSLRSLSEKNLAVTNTPADGMLTFPVFFVLGGCSTCGKIGAVQHHFRILDPSAPSPIPMPVLTASTKQNGATAVELSGQEGWIPLCDNCFDRMEAVARLYEFIRVLRTGVYTGRDLRDMFAEVGGIRRDMFVSRIGGVRKSGSGGNGYMKMRNGRSVSSVNSSGSSVDSVYGNVGLGRQLGSTSRLSNEIL
ncbi:hypothetical protein HK100_002325 [Physocladia obscura]|uniref:GDP/GTP exchange factor Sec2 N-terminal domain-containing protein n=1 Tax=Physocladia obscura TaxID=109957 RepID=A0AAD5T9P3_9FUNG|nr:hypothetical protein HK100_002325 [Physocladia obscura]